MTNFTYVGATDQTEAVLEQSSSMPNLSEISKSKRISKGFNTRQDVLNKTLLRSIKKYLTSSFEQEENFKRFTPAEKYQSFKPLLRGFVERHYASLLSDSESDRNFTFEDVYYYIGIIINFNFIKRGMRNKRHIKFNVSLYDCLYKYTHTKLSKLCGDEILRFLFLDFIESGKIYEHLQSDETMALNKEKYEKTIGMFKAAFSKGTYAHN